MKIKESEINRLVPEFGFVYGVVTEIEDVYSPFECLARDHSHYYEIGHSRRGQRYFLLVSKDTRELFIYASRPDGSGCEVLFPDIVKELMWGGIIE